MKYIGGIITAYIVLLVLDIMQRRNHTRTQSLKKFTVRTITDVSFICAIGALFVLVAFIWCLWSDPETFCSKGSLMIIIPFVSCIIKIPIIAEGSPQSCRGNFPIIAEFCLVFS